MTGEIDDRLSGDRAALAAGHSGQIVFIAIELLIPMSDSLKAKRRVVKGLKDRIRARLNASVAEIGYLEQWQRALIGVAMIGNDRVYLEQGASALESLSRETAGAELLGFHLEWL
ncbi:MAG: hypothetical protein FD165_1258 [Gammaproteobacteria bacterium]|nr:MAG: hypothetical protein FD165_1258 [Gammaproteobacteria bacterium]TND05757.1 MAG: hypothetical protein FD120_970 [Gammaproteobacteria bacterium]